MSDDLGGADRPKSVAGQIDAVCEAFERAWESGQVPRIEDHLAKAKSHGALPFRNLLVELVMIDLERRWRAGDGSGPTLESYVDRFSELGPWDGLPQEMISHEYRCRHCWGDRPDHGEYLKRFAGHGSGLSRELAAVDETLSAQAAIDREEKAAPCDKPSPGVGATESTSRSLIRRVRANDAQAWQRLVTLYAPLVYSWCRRSGLGAEDAADVLQESLRAVSRGISEFRHERPGDTFRGWLRVIVRNKICDHFRRANGQPEAEGGSDAQRRFAEVAADESATGAGPGPLTRLVRQALDLIRPEFEEHTWQAFWLTSIEERKSTDAGQQLGMSPNAVRQAKYRVLRRLRQELGDLG